MRRASFCTRATWHQQELLHRSPFHADVFRSFSWSVNICGRKKWFFFPPGQEEALRDCHGGLPYDVTSPTLLDSRIHPMRDPARGMELLPGYWPVSPGTRAYKPTLLNLRPLGLH